MPNRSTKASTNSAGNSEQLNRFLEFLASFHRYSIGNLMLIYVQKPEATQVAGFHAWKTLGRRVMKGEKGIAILAPVIRKKKSDGSESTQKPDDDDEQRRAVVGYRVAHVFDASQTDGDPLPEFAEASGDPGEYTDRLRRQIRNLGIELVEDWIPGGADGMSEGGRITVKPNLSPAKLTATLIHELAHL